MYIFKNLEEMIKEESIRYAAIRHDLDETLSLLMEHRKNGYAGLGYEAKNDGEGGRTVTIRFPSPSDQAKYEAMVADGTDPANLTQPGAVPGEDSLHPDEKTLAKKREVEVRIAMPETAEEILEKTASKYPKQFLDGMQIKRK